jgi:glycosyltransferase involved in cell wall biosynthesis
MPPEPLTVAIDARLEDGRAGGVQQFVIGLASALCALDGGNEDYAFLGRPPEQAWLSQYIAGRGRLLDATARPTGIRGIRRVVGDRVPGARWISRRLRRPRASDGVVIAATDGTLEAAGIDVVHFTFQGAFTTELPSIYQPWDLQHIHLPQFFTDAQRRWRDAAYRCYSERADVVVVASEWAREDVVRHLGVPASKVAVIGVPPVLGAYPTPDEATIERTRIELALPARFAYYPAQTWPHKNHVRLLEAVAILRDRDGVDIDVICSGIRNAHHAEITRVARRLGLADRVRFVGFVEPLQIQALYRLARFLVFPSLFEGWGLPILEAFSAGTPVACSNVTSLPALVGDAALVFDPRDVDDIARAIERLWQDDDLRATLAARGREVVEGYDWGSTARAFRAHYRAIAGRELTSADRELLARGAVASRP